MSFQVFCEEDFGYTPFLSRLRSGTIDGTDPNALPGQRRPRKIKVRKSHNRKHHKPRK